MEKRKFKGKLNLKKETISKLNESQMNDIKGGYIGSSANGWPCVCFTTLLKCKVSNMSCNGTCNVCN